MAERQGAVSALMAGKGAMRSADPASGVSRRYRPFGAHGAPIKSIRAEPGPYAGPGNNSAQLQPDRCMVRGLFHGAQVVIHAGRLDPWLQAAGGHDQVDAQAALGLVLETAAAVIEPAEAVIHLGVEEPEAVGQAPVLQGSQPFTFLRQKAALAALQPALAVVFADADIAVFRGNIDIAHHH